MRDGNKPRTALAPSAKQFLPSRIDPGQMAEVDDDASFADQ
jgi:hypothetical protein